jgi:hypothetical protein
LGFGALAAFVCLTEYKRPRASTACVDISDASRTEKVSRFIKKFARSRMARELAGGGRWNWSVLAESSFPGVIVLF